MVFQESADDPDARAARDMHDVTGELRRLVGGVRRRDRDRGTSSTSGARPPWGRSSSKPGLQGDLPDLLDRLIPPSEGYGHERAWQ